MPRRDLPDIDERYCTMCGDCVRICPTDCLMLELPRGVVVSPSGCINCAICVAVCPASAIAMQLQDW